MRSEVLEMREEVMMRLVDFDVNLRRFKDGIDQRFKAVDLNFAAISNTILSLMEKSENLVSKLHDMDEDSLRKKKK